MEKARGFLFSRPYGAFQYGCLYGVLGAVGSMAVCGATSALLGIPQLNMQDVASVGGVLGAVIGMRHGFRRGGTGRYGRTTPPR